MQKSSNCADYMVEFKKALNGELEICYFENSQDSAFRSWVLPKEIVYELILWWKKLQKNNIQLPIIEKTDICEFNMFTEKSLDIRESVSLRGLTLVGYLLPKVVVEELIDWDGNK
ncbi:MAG: hypothetical protein H8D23_01805 [Candidatus Brocadiales bacterium]|nr:hypothetical protein [Candidatus Brocadiales bacterium]